MLASADCPRCKPTLLGLSGFYEIYRSMALLHAAAGIFFVSNPEVTVGKRSDA